LGHIGFQGLTDGIDVSKPRGVRGKPAIMGEGPFFKDRAG
jgi:hypothetical protein